MSKRNDKQKFFCTGFRLFEGQKYNGKDPRHRLFVVASATRGPGSRFAVTVVRRFFAALEREPLHLLCIHAQSLFDCTTNITANN